MTLTERVLRHLEETRGEWALLGSDLLRCWAGCPLDALRPGWRHKHHVRVFEDEDDETRVEALTDEEVALIRAADCAEGHDPALRAAMLEAAGLTEEAIP